MKCKMCSEPVTDVVGCGACRGSFHFACIGMQETAYRKMNADRKAAVRCPQCRATPDNSSGTAAVLEEIKALRTEFGSMKTQINNVLSSMEALNTKWNLMETRFSDLEDRVIAMETKTTVLPKLEAELDLVKEKLSNLQNENNVRDQFARLNNLEISGVPLKKGSDRSEIDSGAERGGGVMVAARRSLLALRRDWPCPAPAHSECLWVSIPLSNRVLIVNKTFPAAGLELLKNKVQYTVVPHLDFEPESLPTIKKELKNVDAIIWNTKHRLTGPLLDLAG
ncbi:hypothetical protein MSG28_013373 [Choristoneura fumiferana]|uniref:Uncharacterized protein n=1 Tax=Choristoneura fumiferana TaxID=7141 RepID=A0ACC0KT69_CHOFU|nr:hypothetical protein MSG28_013373 [Choristoneura fumiferana]